MRKHEAALQEYVVLTCLVFLTFQPKLDERKANKFVFFEVDQLTTWSKSWERVEG